MSELVETTVKTTYKGENYFTYESSVTMPTAPRRVVVSVVPMPVTPHVELLSCGHAGLLHPPDVKHPEQHIGDTRECLTCKWGEKP